MKSRLTSRRIGALGTCALILQLSLPSTALADETGRYNLAPDCSAASAMPNNLWPVNHKFVDIEIEGISDTDGSIASIQYMCVDQDEAINGTGDGNFEPDAVINAERLQLRAQRSGNNNGRFYHVDFIATDNHGAQCGGQVKVRVDKSRKQEAIDDGRLYSSLGNAQTCPELEVNNPPQIYSTPLTQIIALEQYSYTIEAHDPDLDPLTYQLVQAPIGVTIEGNVISWVPQQEQEGFHNLVVSVSDGSLSTEQNWQIEVLPIPNKPPVITSEPIVEVTWPQAYSYVVVAFDEDEDPITYELLENPPNATINSITGVITWDTSNGVIGEHPFVVKANDNNDTFDTQSFTVMLNAPSNYPPQITSVPGTYAQIEQDYQYQVTATDRDNDILTYSLLSAPDGMTIDSQSGQINWPVAPSQVGSNLVVVSVSDAQANDEQSFNVEVTAPNNTPPQIVSMPILQAVVGELYGYQVEAVDAQGHNISYSLVNGPQQMTIDASSGLISWIAQDSDVGNTTILVKATDDPGLSDTQEYLLNVSNTANLPPQITSTGPLRTPEQAPYEYQVTVQDDGDVLEYQLLQAPQGMSIDPVTGLISWPENNLMPQGSLLTNSQCHIIQDATTRVSGAADVLVVVDESGSMSGEHVWLKDLVPALENGLINAGVGSETSNLYGLVGYERTPRYLRSSSDEYMIEAARFDQIANQLRLYGGFEDGYRAMTETLRDYPLREQTAKNLILVSDEDEDNGLGISYDQMKETLLNSNTILNAVVNGSFRCGDGSSAIGMASDGLGFIADGEGGYYTCTGAYATGGSGRTIRDYVELAIDTGGAAWDLNYLRSGGVRAQSFSAALVDIKVKEIIEQLPPIEQSDLQINDIKLDQVGDTVTFSAQLLNRGLADMENPVALAVYSDGQLIGQVDIASLPAPSQQALSITNIPVTSIGQTVSALIVGQNDECQFNNNEAIAAVAQVVVTDEFGESATQWVTVNVAEVNQAPILATVAPVTLEVGEQYQYQLSAQDPDIGDGLVYSINDGPVGVAINASSGVVTWQPSQSDVGNVIVTVAVADLAGAQGTTTIDIQVLDFLRPPIIQSEPVTQAQVGASYSYQVVASSDRNAQLSYRLTEAPTGMTINELTGQIQWRPDQPSADGGHVVVVEVIDDKNLVAIQSFTITALSTSEAPEFTSQPSTYLSLGELYQYQVVANEASGQAVSVVLQQAPVGMSIDANQLVSWQPSATGLYQVVIAATSVDGLQTIQSFEIQVVDVANLPPTISSAPVWQNINGDLVYQVIASDPESTSLTYSLEQAPAGMVVNATGEVRWPKLAQLDGHFTVRVRVTDADGVFAEQGFTFSYYPSNQLPQITSQPIGVSAVDTLYQYFLSASDGDGDPVTFSLDNAPQGASIADGVINWTPTTAQLGSQSFVVRVTDALGGATTQSFNVTVLEVLNNAAPNIVSTPTFEVFAGQLYNYQLIAADGDGDALNYRLIESPSSMFVDNNGLISWTPSGADKGGHTIVVRVYDTYGAYAEQSYTLNVNAGGEPVITSLPVLTGYNSVVYQYQLAVLDNDDTSFTYQLVSAPYGMTVSNDGLIQWAVGDNATGQYLVDVSVFDALGNSDSQSYNLEVKYIGDSVAPVIESQANLRAKTETVYQYQVIATDVDGDRLSYRLDNGPTGMTVSDSGLVEWLATEQQIGVVAVTLVVSDSTGKSTSQSFYITVTGPGKLNRRACRVPQQ